MTKRPKTPADIADRVKRYRATTEFFEQRARRPGANREHLIAKAEEYRKLAEEVEAALPPRKPPAPSA